MCTLYFNVKTINLFLTFVCAGSLLPRGLFSSCGARAAPCGSFSCCSTWTWLLCGMWDLPSPGIEPVSPALTSRFFTTEPLGKPGVCSAPRHRKSSGSFCSGTRIQLFRLMTHLVSPLEFSPLFIDRYCSPFATRYPGVHVSVELVSFWSLSLEPFTLQHSLRCSIIAWKCVVSPILLLN